MNTPYNSNPAILQSMLDEYKDEDGGEGGGGDEGDTIGKVEIIENKYSPDRKSEYLYKTWQEIYDMMAINHKILFEKYQIGPFQKDDVELRRICRAWEEDGVYYVKVSGFNTDYQCANNDEYPIRSSGW